MEIWVCRYQTYVYGAHTLERILHNIPINWITYALSQTSVLNSSVYFSALFVNLHTINITSNVVPVVETIRYKSTGECRTVSP